MKQRTGALPNWLSSVLLWIITVLRHGLAFRDVLVEHMLLTVDF
jgi:hypothetical protein